ncbi:MAG: Serine dehydratase alpha chain [Synergistetes bacterium ADurb.BinA166]|nr:MAG: Serine dehydratase alpha chain [Synergistetes bacterium ADurb.BinA166]
MDLNLRLAEHGLRHGSGLGIGSALERMVDRGTVQRDMITAAKILASAAADARMDGVRLPAMSSAGSGNHGLTAILPIWAVKPYAPPHLATERRVLEAIALSHIITGFIKAYTGRLSALCGCSVAAGAGATAGVAYLLGGDLEKPERISAIAGAIENLMGDLAGMICDGAKPGCALKISTALSAAFQASLLSLRNIEISERDGIIENDLEKTIRNVGTIASEGMNETDRLILEIMVCK